MTATAMAAAIRPLTTMPPAIPVSSAKWGSFPCSVAAERPAGDLDVSGVAQCLRALIGHRWRCQGLGRDGRAEVRHLPQAAVEAHDLLLGEARGDGRVLEVELAPVRPAVGLA